MSNLAYLERARSAKNKGIRYGMGKGGYFPSDPLPCRKSLKLVKLVPTWALWCDCSGFIAWVLGRSRKASKDWKWWLSTDSIWADAKGPQILFERLLKPEPGCLAVYPDWRDKIGKKHEGHVAVVADVDLQTVVDSSGSQGGVTEHPAPYFWSGSQPTVWCRYKAAA
jgi:hypothetical protein